ncbi:AAA family ATPase [Campylobacter ureolyticus]|nr:AAA family ATPase [Campylobacter ureolyticus]
MTLLTKYNYLIDDPISSLDSNHIFFIFSLIKMNCLMIKN